jgi:hypothetical protein
MTARRIAGVGCAIASLLAVLGAGTATAAPSDYAFETASASISTAVAGSHPDFTTAIKFTQETEPPNAPFGRTRDLSFELPRGLVGNPTNVKQCSLDEFPPDFTNALASCPQDSQVGVIHVELATESNEIYTPVYALEPPAEGNVVARLGFIAAFFPVYIDVRVRSASDYGLTATITTPPSQLPLIKADTTLWGVPASHSHDAERFSYAESLFCGGPCGAGKESGLPPAPFLTNPTSCGPQSVEIAADSYLEPERVIRATAPLPDIVECERVGFEPSLTVTPTNPTAGEPTGLETHLRMPQNELPDGVATSELRDASVTLPPGMTINPAAADGLAACSAAQVGFEADGASSCPQAAQIGTATVVSPGLSRPLHGEIYQRTPQPGHLFRLWLVTDELGVHLKLPGEVRADPVTGQLTTTFAEAPQLPAEEIDLDLKGGARAPLKNPETCGGYSARYVLTPWSGQPASTGEAQMTIDRGCGTGGFDPRLSAGAANPTAGDYSPFLLDLRREDGEQNIERVTVSPPPGELAKLAGVPLCPDAQAGRGECPAASQIGSVDVAAGAGTLPLRVPQVGKQPTAVYLAGPYRGAPYSLIVKVPAQAGPFDLGTVATRAGIFVDPATARVTVAADPLPQILEGVPIEYRMLHVAIDRPGFSLNPTSCEPMSVGSRIVSSEGASASPQSRFQVGSCASLKFKPRMTLRLRGGTRRTAHPKLIATLRSQGAGAANIARVQVKLPHSSFLDQAHIRTVCTRAQFAAGGGNGAGCPQGSVYGHAWVKTPLFDYRLSGNVYLRSSSHELPDLVLALSGPGSQPIQIEVAGRIDSVEGALRSTFEGVPDAPFEEARVVLFGGKQGLLVNSSDLCDSRQRAAVGIEGQNGRLAAIHPVVRDSCGSKGAGRSRLRHH